MSVEISSTILARIIAQARGEGAAREACGILRGDGAAVTRAEPTANVSPTPQVAFEIDPAALLGAYRDARRGDGPAVIGFYHTHPSGDDAPSATDAACAAPDGKLWLIATGAGARLWRAVPDGAVHGRFVPVPIDLRTGSHVEKGMPAVRYRDLGTMLAHPVPESLS